MPLQSIGEYTNRHQAVLTDRMFDMYARQVLPTRRRPLKRQQLHIEAVLVFRLVGLLI